MGIVALFTGSFHSAAIYRAVRQSGGLLIGYSLAVVSICTLALTLYYGSYVHRGVFAQQNGGPSFFDQVVTQIADQTPVMTLKDNKLVTQNPAPTVIKISGSIFDLTFKDYELITIDTRGKTSHENMKTPMLLTADAFIMKSDNETKIHPLSDFTKDAPNTILINHAMAENTGKNIITYMHTHLVKIYIVLGSICWLFFVFGAFLLRICMLLSLALAGQFIGMVTKNPVTYGQAFALAALSYTPVTVLDTALMIGLGYSPHLFTLLLAGIVGMFAALAFSKEVTTPTPSPFA